MRPTSGDGQESGRTHWPHPGEVGAPRPWQDQQVTEDPQAESQDRWTRSDWWGVVLDAPDVGVLTRFYSELRGWPIWKQDANGAALDIGEGVAYLAVQRNPDYVRPVWPSAQGHQQMLVHLDFEVVDLEEAVAHALSLGAELPDHQPQENVRVLLDPAGHPFCLYTSGADQ